jgi:hypothetical protein
MGLFDRLKRKPTGDEPRKGQVPVRVEFTNEETEAIEQNRKEFAEAGRRIGGKDKTLYLSQRMADALDAIGLSQYVITLLAGATRPEADKAEASALLRKADAAQAKVLGFHDIPYYRFLWARISELSGDFESADRRYALALELDNAFEPDADDQIAMQYLSEMRHDVAGVQRKARAAVRASLYLEAIGAEAAIAEKVLENTDGAAPRPDRLLTIAALQAVLWHAAAIGMAKVGSEDIEMVTAVMRVRLAIHSQIPNERLDALFTAVDDQLTREPPTAENGPSLWARLVFALKDAGYEIEHVFDFLWVLYAQLVYPAFAIRARTLASKFSRRDDQSLRAAREFIALDTAAGFEKFERMARQVLGKEGHEHRQP